MSDMHGADARRNRRSTRSWARRALIGSLVALCTTVSLGTAGVSAQVARAASSTDVLFKDSLAKPSTAVKAAKGSGGLGVFVGGKYRITTTGQGATMYSPVFPATGTELSSVRTDVDVSLANKQAFAGLNCRMASDRVTRYAFLISGTGGWVLGKSSSATANDALKQGQLKGNGDKKAFHLTFECSGEEQPGTTGSVTLKFLIDGKTVASVTDSTSALPVDLPSAVAMETDVGSASFSNMAVKQT